MRKFTIRSLAPVALLAIAFSTTALTDAYASTKPRRTAISKVNPTSTKTHLLKTGYKIKHTESGDSYCQSSNLVSGAARCFVDNIVYDPCWAFRLPNSDYSGEACLSSPWSRAVTRLSGMQTGPGPSSTHGRTLWGLRLRNGAKCLETTGAVGDYNGHGYRFVCDDGRKVIDKVNRTKPQWRVRTVTHRRGKAVLGKAYVTRAYIGYGQEGR